MSDIDREGTPQTPVMSESPNPVTPRQFDDQQEPQRSFVIIPQDQQIKGFHMHSNYHRDINPYTRPLTISDLESVLTLENAAFTDPNERASREKVGDTYLNSTYIEIFHLTNLQTAKI